MTLAIPLLLNFVLILILQNCDASPKVDPLVNTKLGLIQGLKANDGDYSMFMGIPYARVDPSNPFGPSLPQGPFDRVFEAVDDSAICPQTEEFNNTITGSLDCLHLNVYVPSTAASKNKLPVLVWIYGGGYSIGFAGRYLYGPKYLVRHEIILVTVNYRLGPYGFMCLDTPEVPGNQGLKDQLTALRWINDNIEAFGGDTNKITVFGESAGSMSVDLHLLSSQEKLFDKAIMQSGTSLLPINIQPTKDAPLKLAAHLGFVSDNINDALSFLASVDPKLIIAAASELNLTFRPCIEQQFEGVENIITENWFAPSRIPKVNRMPILIGYNDDERFMNYYNKPESFFDGLNVFHDILSESFDMTNPHSIDIRDIVRRFYIGDADISQSNHIELANFESDFSFVHPTYRTIARYLANNAGDIYHYVFSYTGDRNFLKRRRGNTKEGGAAHADEIGYLFDISFFDETPTDEDQIIIDRITSLWANFVKHGNPTPDISELLPVQWKPITKNSLQYAFNINSEVSLGTRPFQSRMAFWDLVYKMKEILYPENN